MAYIRKHGDGWRAEVERNGVRRSAKWPTKREAQDWAARTELELKAGKGRSGTVRQAFDRHGKGKDRWTVNRLRMFADWIDIHVGKDAPMDEVTREHIADWRDSRLETVTASTVVRDANLYRAVWNIARDEWQWITESPWPKVRMPQHNPPRHQRWDWRKIRRVCRMLGWDSRPPQTKSQEVAWAFLIALRTALRAQEVLQAPEGFDPATRVVTLGRTKTTQRGQIVRVPVTRQAARLLSMGKFTLTGSQMDGLFRKARDRAMVGDLTFHDARATSLTLLAKRVDILVLSRISRHKDLKMLSQVYYRATAAEIAAGL